MSETTIQAVETANIEDEKIYTLRELQAQDVFLMSKIISAIGIEEFKNVFNADIVETMIEGKDGKDVTQAVGIEVFFEIAGIILNNLSKCEKDVYTFISKLSGVPAQEVETLPMNTFFNIIIDIVKKDEFKDFMQVVSKLFK